MYHLFYFSGTGNTWWIAGALRSALQDMQHNVPMHSVEEQIVFDDLPSDAHLIIGFPAYGSSAPYPMRRFIETLPDGHGRAVSIFVCHAMASGDTGLHVGAALQKKGYALRCILHMRTPNNIHIPSFRFTKPMSTDAADRFLEKRRSDVQRFARAIVSGKIVLCGAHPFGRLLGSVQRRHVDAMIKKAGGQLAVVTERCAQCGICTTICPVGNISRERDRYAFGNECVLCMRCYNACPTNAICFGAKCGDTRKYPRYRDPGGFIQWCVKQKRVTP